MSTKQKREETPVLVPATRAANKLGISRRTLKRHIGAGLVRSVTHNTRTFIPQVEIERIVRGEPVSSQNETKPRILAENSSSKAGADNSGHARTPDERFLAIFEGENWRHNFMERLEEWDRETQLACTDVATAPVSQ